MAAEPAMIPGWVSAIVPTIGRPESVALLLGSLAAQSRRPDEVIIADGSEADEVKRVVEQPVWASRLPGVRRLPVQPPNAVGQRMAAIAASRGEHLLFLDDDVVLEPGCLAAMLDLSAGDTTIVAVTGDFNNQTWPGPTRTWRWVLRYGFGLAEGAWQGRVVGPLMRFGYRPSPGQPAPMEWFGTTATLVRRSAYDQAGGFSEYFLRRSTMNEDVDLSLRVATVGRIVLCPAARYGHFHDPAGRVSPLAAAEDDLYNRYLIMRWTQRRPPVVAFGLALLFFVVETASSLGGSLLRLRTDGWGSRTVGRARALARILVSAPSSLGWR